MSAFDDLLQEAEDAGVQKAWLDRLRAASDGSPLRQKIQTLEGENATLKDENGKYRQSALGTTLKTFGFPGNPEALRVPDDLDPFDTEKVTEWAAGMGLITPPPPTAEQQARADEDQAHIRMTNAAAGAEHQTPIDAKRAEALAASTPEEFERLARLHGFAK